MGSLWNAAWRQAGTEVGRRNLNLWCRAYLVDDPLMQAIFGVSKAQVVRVGERRWGWTRPLLENYR